MLPARTVTASLALAATLALPCAAAVQNPNPRTKPDTIVAEGIRLIEAKEWARFLQAFVPPEEFKRITEQAPIEQFAKAFGESGRGDALLAALKSVKGATPTLDADGTTATYKLKEPVAGMRDTLTFIKVGEFWYLKN